MAVWSLPSTYCKTRAVQHLEDQRGEQMDGHFTTPPFTVTKADFIEFASFHARKGRVRLWPRAVRWGLYAGLLFLLGWAIRLLAVEPGGRAVQIVLPIILIVSIWSFFIYYMGKAQWSRVKSDPMFNHDTVVSIDAHGASWRNSASSGTQGWPHIPKVVETDNLILVYFGENSAMLVPKRVFQSPHDLKTFSDSALEFKARS
jgi:hypothetical protein